ncbi:putative non-specific serine/threonine protein kinase [Helianthus debilis subsp. tardiflorus]
MSVRSSYPCFSCFHLLFWPCFVYARSSNQNSQCNDIERQALLQFKHGLIDESQRLASWVAENKDCCTWAGIACDNSTGHVHHIHLPGSDGHCDILDYGMTLKGEISHSLLDLKQLKHLDLSCNDFEGIQVPKFIGSFQNLRYLNLSYSNFGGNIAPQLGNLSELHVLSLGSFHGPFYETTSMANMKCLSTLGMLHHLDMSGMDLSKATDWLQVINTLPSLVQLHLSGCELSNLHVFRNLTSLELLHIAKNDFMKSSSIFQNLSSSNLISLDIANCGISSSVLDSLQNLTNLISLDLSRNQLTKRIPKSLGFCPIPYSIERLSSLERLYVGYSQINGSFPNSNSIGQLSSLEILDAIFNKLDVNLPDSIGQLSSLEELSISYNRLDGSLPDSLGQLSKLTYLDFSYNLLTGVVTEDHFIKLVSLKDLKGSANKLILRLQVASWIPPFQLGTLSLRNWVLGPQFSLWLQSQKDLEELDISNTDISSPMPELFVRSFSKLWYLNMSNNHIRGPLLFSGIPATL